MSFTTIRSRRDFIKQAALAGGMVTLLGACGSSKLFKLPVASNALKKFRENFKGKVVLPGETEYEKLRQVRYKSPANEKFPAIIAQCKDEEDIIRCIDFAHQHTMECAVRSGNHSYLGWGSSDGGIVIDVSNMKEISVDPLRGRVRVSAGVTAAEILAATSQYGLAPVLGQCGSVGSGLALGGGVGWLSGRFGATCDNVISARVTSAAGVTMIADEITNKDLYWGIRGGGGNFGVVNTFEHKLYPVREILAGGFTYPLKEARPILRFFKEFMSAAPDEMQGLAYFDSAGTGCLVLFVYSGNLEKGEKLIDTFRKFKTPSKDWVKRRTYAETYTMPPYTSSEPTTTLPCPYHIIKGSYIQRLSDESIDLVLDRFSDPPPGCEIWFDFDHYMHGEVCRVPSDATAFQLREEGAVHLAFGGKWRNPSDGPKCTAWLNDTWLQLQKFSGGRVYSNYQCTEGERTIKGVYGTNYARLLALKKKYDPDNLFRRNQNIVPL